MNMRMRFDGIRNLNATNKNDDDNGDDDDDMLPRPNLDDFAKKYVMVDLASIAIACQLLGLTDALNDPEFVQRGGWLQPIPAIPSSLSTLVMRFSLNAVAWTTATSATSTLTWWWPSNQSTETEETSGDSQQQRRRERSVIGTTVANSAVFVMIRLQLLLLMALFGAGRGDDDDFTGHVVEILRESYVVGLTTTTFRYLYSILHDDDDNNTY